MWHRCNKNTKEKQSVRIYIKFHVQQKILLNSSEMFSSFNCLLRLQRFERRSDAQSLDSRISEFASFASFKLFWNEKQNQTKTQNNWWCWQLGSKYLSRCWIRINLLLLKEWEMIGICKPSWNNLNIGLQKNVMYTIS